MAKDDDLDDAFAALAKAEGKSVTELKREIVRERLGARGTTGDRLAMKELPPADGDEESPAEARERYFREESLLPDGVHGLGGMSAGGIFGDGPIATTHYDPSAHSRGELRAGNLAQVKLLGIIDRLERRLGMAEEQERRSLPGGGGHQLQGRRR